MDSAQSASTPSRKDDSFVGDESKTIDESGRTEGGGDEDEEMESYNASEEEEEGVQDGDKEGGEADVDMATAQNREAVAGLSDRISALEETNATMNEKIQNLQEENQRLLAKVRIFFNACFND